MHLHKYNEICKGNEESNEEKREAVEKQSWQLQLFSNLFRPCDPIVVQGRIHYRFIV